LKLNADTNVHVIEISYKINGFSLSALFNKVHWPLIFKPKCMDHQGQIFLLLYSGRYYAIFIALKEKSCI
jgi:hypothetical protein